MAQQNDNTPKPTPAFFPGQKGLLSQQLSWGFGKSPQHWSHMLDQTYSPLQPMQPYKYAYVPPTDGGDGKPNDPGKPGKPGGGKDDDPGLPSGYPWNSHSALPAGMGLAALQQNQPPQLPMPTMPQYQQFQQPMQPAQQQMMGQQQNGLMALNPQILAYLRAYGGR